MSAAVNEAEEHFAVLAASLEAAKKLGAVAELRGFELDLAIAAANMAAREARTTFGAAERRS